MKYVNRWNILKQAKTSDAPNLKGRHNMTKKDEQNKRDKDYKKKQSDLLKDKSAEEINRKFREGVLWDKKK